MVFFLCVIIELIKRCIFNLTEGCGSCKSVQLEWQDS